MTDGGNSSLLEKHHRHSQKNLLVVETAKLGKTCEMWLRGFDALTRWSLRRIHVEGYCKGVMETQPLSAVATANAFQLLWTFALQSYVFLASLFMCLRLSPNHLQHVRPPWVMKATMNDCSITELSRRRQARVFLFTRQSFDGVIISVRNVKVWFPLCLEKHSNWVFFSSVFP